MKNKTEKELRDEVDRLMTNLMINLCSIISIILGLTTMWNMLKLNINYFGIEFITYLMGGFGFVIGLLTLFRE